MPGLIGGEGSTDPQKLEGKSNEDSKPREFFWDSVSLYVVGVIIALAAVDVVTEFIRGSSVSCILPQNMSVMFTEAYINSYCAASLPPTEYFPVFIVVHAILIAIPHYLWLNHYGGNFEFFFTQAKEMDRTRNEETGDYLEKNRIIIQQLTQAFTTYKQNWMFILYVLKILVQLGITVAGFFAAVFAFTDFRENFMCPTVLRSADPFWPFEAQVGCVFTSLRLFYSIRLADLILLALLILSLLWSLVWCASTHPTELSTDEAAVFCFQSSMAPEHFVPTFPVKGCRLAFKRCLQNRFTSVSVIGRGQTIKTNLDFLVMKLFRTDSGLGFVFREMQILEKIRHHNDDDQRRTNLHKRQQQATSMKDGDLITPLAVKGYEEDLKWHFSKEAKKDGIFDQDHTPFKQEETLILPDSLRGAIIGLSSLAPDTERAIFVNFGSVSLGIPSALARVFTKVGVVNFNPYFKQAESAEFPFEVKEYASDIVEVLYPENVLASEIEKSSEFVKGLTDIWRPDNTSTDFIVIGPVDNKLHLSTISLFLAKIAKINEAGRTTRFSKGCVLLTVHPKEVGAKDTGNEFHQYIPPAKYFHGFSQKVFLNKEARDLQWPPVAPDNEPPGAINSSTFDLRLICGHSHSTFKFNLYKYPPPVLAVAQAAPPPNPSTRNQQASQVERAIPVITNRHSSAGYTEVSFNPDHRGNVRASLVATPPDKTVVNYSEISIDEV